jgi:two-component system chemotaxis response regulator CheB
MTAAPPRSIVVVGTSWGGLDALRSLLGALPSDLAAAVVVAQHRSAESHPTALRDLLGAATRLPVVEPSDKDELRAGAIFLAPPDYHLLVDGAHVGLSVDAAVAYSRPSIDVLFESAAESYRARCVGVILTGANADGAHGLARIAELGGAAIVQDPATAERREMPAAALAAAPAARVAFLNAIAPLVVELCGLVEIDA